MYSSIALEIIAHCDEGSFYCEACWESLPKEKQGKEAFGVPRHELWDYAETVREEWKMQGEEIADEDAVVTCEACYGDIA